MSTFSMDDGDGFNPTTIIAPPEFSLQISKVSTQLYTSVESYGIL